MAYRQITALYKILMGYNRYLSVYKNLIIIITIILTTTIIVIRIIIISNSNWTEWSTVQGVIARVISKSDEREARGRFEITSTITP